MHRGAVRDAGLRIRAPQDLKASKPSPNQGAIVSQIALASYLAGVVFEGFDGPGGAVFGGYF